MPERRQSKRYVLTVLRENGQYEPLTEEELDRFEQQFPDIAKFWLDPAALDSLPLPKVPDSAPLYESWDKAAKRLMSSLWKSPNAWVFYEPVDPEKQGVPHYLSVIKTPMDFGTIK